MTLEQLVNGVAQLASVDGVPTQEHLIEAVLLQPADFLVKNLSQLEITDQQAILCCHGNPFKPEAGQNLQPDTTIRIYLAGCFLGVGQVSGVGKDLKIQPLRLVSTANS